MGMGGLRFGVNEAVEAILARKREMERAANAAASPPSTNAHSPVRSPNLQQQSLEELRRQQAAFRKVREDLDRENWWMAIPALAPAAAVLSAEAAAAIAGRLAAPLAAGPLALTKRDPVPKVGDHWGTRKGRRAHKALEERLEQKEGWKYEPRYPGARPDVGAPARNPAKPGERYLMELKPNTPSGQRAGAKQIKRYKEQTGNKGRVIYYDPKDF
jgi:hypothetical protein